MIKVQTNQLLQEMIAAAFILLFAYTGISKLLDHATFLNALEHSPLPAYLSYPLSYLVPIDEIILAGMLLIPAFRRTAFMIAAFAMTAFTIYIIWILTTASELPCSCGGVIGSLSWESHLVFNILFLALGVQGYILSRPRQIVGLAEHP